MDFKMSRYAVFYLCIALIYIFLFYAETTGFKLSQFIRADEPVEQVQRVPVEQPETEEEQNG